MADSFLGRWSQRKQAVREGKALDEPEPVAKPAPAVVSPQVASAEDPEAELAAQAPAAPPPTLEDVKELTPQSNFAPFVARDVAPEVRNAAMKKLFTDPHFNVMDRLDTYIDDYSQPDPIPMEMLRKLASAKFLGLFDEEEKQEAEEAARRAREVADNPTHQTVAQSAAAPAVPSALPNDDPDLRLQQDDAPPGKDPGGSAA